MPDDFERMWADLAPVGRSAVSGGYFRQPFSAAEVECRAWFAEQSRARGLRLEHDGNGNTVAWLESEGADGGSADGGSADGGAVLIGSHLDSVLDGGAFDGPLGVVSSFAALDLLADRGIRPSRPIGVAAFAEEEGSRFGLACLGSRLATGVTAADTALRDPAGVGFAEAMSAAGLEPALGRAAWVDRVGCFLELHVEQGRDLIHREQAVGFASVIWPHGRYRFDFTGEANHAGATAMGDRHDPMLTYAMTALAANKQARLREGRATFGRLDVGPNATNAVPSRVTAWMDARCASEDDLAALVAGITQQAEERAGRDGTRVGVTAESVSPEVRFDVALTARLAGDRPVIPTAAGHDAGVLAGAGIASAMLFVRNPTGISHSPAEHAETADCLAGVEALADALAVLVR